MRYLVAVLAIIASLLVGCELAPQVQTRPNCESDFVKGTDICNGQLLLTQTPESTQIPLTPTPSAIQTEKFALLTKYIGLYAVQMDGFNPNDADKADVLVTSELHATANVVHMKYKVAGVDNVQQLVVVLKEDPKDVPGAVVNCMRTTNPNGTFKNIFYPGSTDEYIFVCSKAGESVENYSGWAAFFTYDPAKPVSITSIQALPTAVP